VKAASAKTGEKVELRRIARFRRTGVVGTYLHFNGKAAVIAEITGGKGEHAVQLGKHVAEHVAAGVPTVAVAVDKDGVPEFVERARHLRGAGRGERQARGDRPEDGRGPHRQALRRDHVLRQPWVRDDKQTIGDAREVHGEGGGRRSP
jgi:translation elongation factor EF-Ts